MQEILILDTSAIREEAWQDFRLARERWETSKELWSSFTHKDQPSFQNWIHETFFALLATIQDCTGAVLKRKALIEAVENEAASQGIGFREAYLNVMNGLGESSDSTEVPETEIDPDPDPDPENESQGARNEEAPPPSPASNSMKARMKHLYRSLARKLHPDANPGSDSGTSADWLEVQNAYEEDDLPRLEALWSNLTEADGQDRLLSFTLWELRRKAAEMDEAVNAFQTKLRSARREPAWGFGHSEFRRKKARKIHSQIQKDLELDLLEIQQALDAMDSFIQEWLAHPYDQVPFSPRRG